MMGQLKKVEDSTFDDVFEKAGGFGPFQWLALFLLLAPEIPSAFVAFSPVVTGNSPLQWNCISDSNNETSYPIADPCECTGKLHSSESSIVVEWQLICNLSWVPDFITSIQMLGMLTGSLVSSQLSDWYGRKFVYLGVCMLMAFGQVLSAIAPNPFVYAVARYFCGAGLSGFMGMSTIYPMEFLTPEWRHLCGSVGPWGEGIMIFAILSYLVPNWRSLLWLTSIPFAFVAVTIPFLPESPRWLLRHGKIEEASRVMRTIQLMNKTHDSMIDPQVLEYVAEQECPSEETRRFSYTQFFTDRTLRRKTFLLMGIWFSWSLVYFGISYNIKNLEGGIYMNVFFMGLVDAIGYPCALLLNNRFGRRKSLIFCMVSGAIFLVSLAILNLIYGAVFSPIFVSGLCLLGKLFVAGARSSARILTSESFPTNIRTMGYGISGITAGVGGIIAPQIAFFGSQWWNPLPFVTFAVVSISGSISSLMLPETAGKSIKEQLFNDYGSTDQHTISIISSSSYLETVKKP